MSQPLMRRARRRDVTGIVTLLADDALGAAREIVSDPPDERYLAAFDAIDRDPNQLLAVAEVDGRLRGCLQLTFLPCLSRLGAWRGQIESVRVDAGARGTGLGRAMIAWACARFRERGCTVAQLTSDKSRADALRFYQELGFKPTHEGMKLHLGRESNA